MNKQWRMRIKIIYQDDYKNTNHYDNIVGKFRNDGWLEVFSSTGYDNHGGYTILVKDRYNKEEK